MLLQLVGNRVREVQTSINTTFVKFEPRTQLEAMKSKYTSPCRFFLILVFIYAVSIGTAAAQSRGRLIVLRDPNLGRNLIINLRIDGRTAANLVRGQRFDRPVWTGRRVLSVSAVPNASRSTSTTVNVRPGRTYVFTTSGLLLLDYQPIATATKAAATSRIVILLTGDCAI